MATLPSDEAIPVPTDLVQQLRTAIAGTVQPGDDTLWHLVHTQMQEGNPSLLPSS
jgi:hypothetical protein